jgi:hypothetical protein
VSTKGGGTKELMKGLNHGSDANTNSDHGNSADSWTKGVLDLQILAGVFELSIEK